MLIAVFSLSVSRCANEQNNAGTRLPYSLASVQRNPARRWLTHLLLIAPIVYPLPILTLCYLFSQELLYNKFPYLKLSFQSLFQLRNFGEQFKTKLLLIDGLLYCLWKKKPPHSTVGSLPVCHLTLKRQHSWEVSKVKLQGLISFEFPFNYVPR